MNQEQIEKAKNDLKFAKTSLAKLPMLGPALWLYGRDELRKFTFVGDLDWLLLPPLVLDQCRLYTKNELPSAFITWACVNDDIDTRLRNGGRLAPHEWKSGEHAWLIDVVSPFSDSDEAIKELLTTVFKDKPLVNSVQRKAAGPSDIKTWHA